MFWPYALAADPNMYAAYMLGSGGGGSTGGVPPTLPGLPQQPAAAHPYAQAISAMQNAAAVAAARHPTAPAMFPTALHSYLANSPQGIGLHGGQIHHPSSGPMAGANIISPHTESNLMHTPPSNLPQHHHQRMAGLLQHQPNHPQSMAAISPPGMTQHPPIAPLKIVTGNDSAQTTSLRLPVTSSPHSTAPPTDCPCISCKMAPTSSTPIHHHHYTVGHKNLLGVSPLHLQGYPTTSPKGDSPRSNSPGSPAVTSPISGGLVEDKRTVATKSRNSGGTTSKSSGGQLFRPFDDESSW